MNVLTKDPEWHARRARAIGSSEIAALFGVQPAYALSHYALWHVKAGIVPPPEVASERVKWGVYLEEVIAAAVHEERGWPVTPGHFVTDGTTPGMSATLDFVIGQADGFEGPGVLETKNVDMIQHKRAWTDGEPPPHILLQLQHQLACTGWKWGAIAGLVGGNRLEVYTYEARPKLIESIRRKVTEFWASIESGKPPAIDGSDSAGDTLRALYPEPRDDALDLRQSNEWPEAVGDFLTAGEMKKSAEKRYSEARNRVEALLAGHKRGWGGGYSVSVSITPAKPDRAAEPGEIIKGRAETRRLIAKEVAL
jgi:putative phage-type endonuclease